MPLRDHFRSPVNTTHSWDEVHGQWPGEIVRHLRTLLPAGFRASPRVHLGSTFEVDIGTFDTADRSPTLSVEADLSDEDEYEVRIFDTERGRELVAVIEIVSPANKDRPESRDKFVTKSAALLQKGVCVSVVDLVSVRHANLYADLLARLGGADPALGSDPPGLYAVTLRGRRPPTGREVLDAWFYPMAVGRPLPTLPVWLRPDVRVLLPLEVSYEETCRVLDID